MVTPAPHIDELPSPSVMSNPICPALMVVVPRTVLGGFDVVALAQRHERQFDVAELDIVDAVNGRGERCGPLDAVDDDAVPPRELGNLRRDAIPRSRCQTSRSIFVARDG
jgi:hypothetical protein